MIRQDYIMRMIEQLVNVLSKIIFNKETKNYKEAIAEADKALLVITGLDYLFIKNLSSGDIIRLLEFSSDKETLKVKCLIAGKLIKERTDLENSIDNDHEIYFEYIKALDLLLEGILNMKREDIEVDKYINDAKEIIVKLQENEIPENIKDKFKKLNISF